MTFPSWVSGSLKLYTFKLLHLQHYIHSKLCTFRIFHIKSELALKVKHIHCYALSNLLCIDTIKITQIQTFITSEILPKLVTHLMIRDVGIKLSEAVQNATGPLLVEIDKTPGSSLGISLTTTSYKGRFVICIEGVKPASIADR